MAERVRITSPRASAARRPPVRGATREIDEQTGVGEVYMRSLMHDQLRLTLSVIGFVVVTLGGLPLLFAVVPVTRSVKFVGIPLPWLLLGVVVYPVLYGAARYYVRRAERIEDEFSDFVDQR